MTLIIFDSKMDTNLGVKNWIENWSRPAACSATAIACPAPSAKWPVLGNAAVDEWLMFAPKVSWMWYFIDLTDLTGWWSITCCKMTFRPKNFKIIKPKESLDWVCSLQGGSRDRRTWRPLDLAWVFTMMIMMINHIVSWYIYIYIYILYVYILNVPS